MNNKITTRENIKYLSSFIIGIIVCSVLLCFLINIGHAQSYEEDPLQVSKDFYALSVSTNRNRGYDDLGELPPYKWEITSAFFSWLEAKVVSENENMSFEVKNRIEAHCIGDDYPESLSRQRGLGFAMFNLSGREDYFTKDVFQEIHLGKGEITTNLNSYLSRCYPDVNLKKMTHMPPYGSIPYLSISGKNSWIEYSEELVELYKTFFSYRNTETKKGAMIKQYLLESQVEQIKQHYNLYSSQKEKIPLKILTAALNHDNLWILLWKHQKKTHHHELPSLRMQLRDNNQVHFVLPSIPKQSNKPRVEAHFPEHCFLEIDANQWSVETESPEWKKITEIHSALEIHECEKLYVQRIWLKSQSGEKIAVDIILAFETDRGELYQLAWGQERLSSGHIYYPNYPKDAS